MSIEPEHVDARRDDSDHAVVGGRRQPARPAALARAAEHEAIDRVAQIGGDSRGSVERRDGGLHHRQEEWPVGLPGADILGKRVGDEVVFDHLAEHRLEGDLIDDGRCHSRGCGKVGEPDDVGRLSGEASAGGGELVARPTVDPEDHRPRSHRAPGNDDGEFVDPRSATPYLARQPGGDPVGGRGAIPTGSAADNLDDRSRHRRRCKLPQDPQPTVAPRTGLPIRRGARIAGIGKGGCGDGWAWGHGGIEGRFAGRCQASVVKHPLPGIERFEPLSRCSRETFTTLTMTAVLTNPQGHVPLASGFSPEG